MDSKELGSLLAIFDTPWFFVGVIVAVGALASLYVRAVKDRKDDREAGK